MHSLTAKRNLRKYLTHMAHIGYIATMRKQFENPARLAVYLETSDLQRLTAKARSEGKLLSEWARERLLGGLGTDHDKALRWSDAVAKAEWGTDAPERPAKPAKTSKIADLPKVCRHGLLDCTVCG